MMVTEGPGVTTVDMLAVSIQPDGSVVVRPYIFELDTVIDCVVCPELHKYVTAGSDVRVTL